MEMKQMGSFHKSSFKWEGSEGGGGGGGGGGGIKGVWIGGAVG